MRENQKSIKGMLLMCMLVMLMALGVAKEASAAPTKLDHYNTDVYYELNNGVLTITGTSLMPYGKDILEETGIKRDDVKKIVIAGNIKSIGSYNFSEYVNLEEVVIGSSVKDIDNNAFEGCTSLKKVTLNEGLRFIGVCSFAGCPNLTEVTIPKSVSNIAYFPFHGYYKETLETGSDIYTAYETEFVVHGYINTVAEYFLTFPEYGVTFDSLGGDISECSVELEEETYTYDGTEKKPSVVLKSKNGHNSLADYSVTYKNNVEVGTATVIITAIAPATGEIRKTFSIVSENSHTHNYTYTSNKDATVFKDGTKTGVCSCGDKVTVADKGSKLNATIKVPAKSFALKTKQAYKGFKVTMGKGDSIVSVKSNKTNILKISSINKKTGTFNLTAQKKTGTAKVTITLKSKKSITLTVKVQKKAVKTTKITMPKAKITLKKGAKTTLKPVITPITSKQQIIYKTSKKSVATVTSKGVITAKKKGTAKIMVKSGAVKKTVTVVVK